MTTKVLSIICIAASTMALAQIKVAAKANLLFPTADSKWKNISQSATQAYESKGKSNVGFNAGLSLKVDLVKNLFLMPELYYTTFKNEFTDPITNTTISAKSNRADLPVLIGIDLLGDHLGVFVGPVASYKFKQRKPIQRFQRKCEEQLHRWISIWSTI